MISSLKVTIAATEHLSDNNKTGSLKPRLYPSILFSVNYRVDRYMSLRMILQYCFYLQIKSIETAIWPLLYPYDRFCESRVADTGRRESSKKAYMLKLNCEIYDYCGTFSLLRFNYDRWLYKTVTGAVAAGHSRLCTPARALDGKAFSPTYWEWQHAFLVDVVHNFGYPHIFLTIRPYEWTFPKSPYVKDRMNHLGRGPTGLATVETLHLAHALEQIVRCYISGKGPKQWKTHLLRDVVLKRNNVITYFYRYYDFATTITNFQAICCMAPLLPPISLPRRCAKCVRQSPRWF